MTCVGLGTLKWGSKIAPPPSLLLTDSLSDFNPLAGGPAATPVPIVGSGAAVATLLSHLPFERATTAADFTGDGDGYSFPNRSQMLADAARSVGGALSEPLISLGESLVARARSGAASAAYGAVLVGTAADQAAFEFVVLHNTSAPHAAPLHVNLAARCVLLCFNYKQRPFALHACPPVTSTVRLA